MATPESTLLEARRSAAPTRYERQFADVLAGVLGVDQVPVQSHFFEELGADSLVMAHFCARVRKQPELPPVSIQDVYRHPTIRSLAAALTATAPREVRSPAPAAVGGPAPASTLEYFTCGALQLLAFLAYSCLAVSGAGAAYEWISEAPDAAGMYVRLVLTGVAAFLAVCTAPIVAKWVLIGRWKPGQIRLWGLSYFRFWFVKTLIRSNPCALLFVGSPLYLLYLRALGANIGPGVAIFSRRDGTSSSASEPCSTSTPPWATGHSSVTPPRSTAARRFRPPSAGTAPRRSARTWTTGGSRRCPRADCAG